MQRIGSLVNLLFVLALAAGCRLPGRDGPISQSLIDCRRLSQQGVVALERGEHREAEALLAKAVAACPVEPEAHRHYAETLWRRGARVEAIAQMEEAARLAGEDAAVSTRMAEMYFACNQTELAWQQVQRALDLDPKSPTAWSIRAGIMRAKGQPQQALADNLRALGYAPRDRRILLECAELYQQLNQPQRALQTLQTLSETYSPGEEPSQVLSLLGTSYVALGRYEDAVVSLSTAVARGEATPETYYRLGEAELLAGRPVHAAAAARQALALQPQHARSRDLLQRIEVAQRPKETLRK